MKRFRDDHILLSLRWEEPILPFRSDRKGQLNSKTRLPNNYMIGREAGLFLSNRNKVPYPQNVT